MTSFIHCDPLSHLDNEVLARFAYTLTLDGKRTRVVETDRSGALGTAGAGIETHIDWVYHELGPLARTI